MSTVRHQRGLIVLGIIAMVAAPAFYFGATQAVFRLAPRYSAHVVLEANRLHLNLLQELIESAPRMEQQEIRFTLGKERPPHTSETTPNVDVDLEVLCVDAAEALASSRELVEQIRAEFLRRSDKAPYVVVPPRAVPVLDDWHIHLLWRGRIFGLMLFFVGAVLLLAAWLERCRHTPPLLPSEQIAHEHASRFDY